MQEDNNPIQQPQIPLPPQSKNVFVKILSKIPKPVFLVAAVAVSIPLVLFVLKGPENITTKPKSEFSLVESSPSDQQNSTPVIAQPTFVFSKKIGVSEKELSKYFTITPKIEGSWHIEKNGQVVYFSSDKKQTGTFPHTFAYQTAYAVTIDKSFRSDSGKQLAEDEHITFKTQQNPEFALTSYKSLMPVSTGDSIDIEVQNYADYAGKYAAQIKQQTAEPYNVTIKKATKDELLSYFVYKKNSYLAINSIPESLARRSYDTATGQYQMKGSGGYQKVLHVVSPVFKTPGIYFVTFGNNYGSDRLFVVASNHVAQMITDNQKSYAVTTDSTNNRAVSGVNVEYYQALDAVKLLDTKSTNGDGIATQSKMTDSDFIVTSKGDDIAVTQTRTYYRTTSSGVENEETDVFSYSDRPIYRPGDTVHYKAVIRVRDENGNNTIKKRTYYIKYSSDYDVTKGDYKKVTTDENGTVTFDTVLPYSETNSYPNITLARKNEKGEYVLMDNLQIGVEFYKKPEMDITVVTNEKEYISRDTSHMTVIGKTNYGQPLSNVKFTYRVMLVDYTEIKDRNLEQIEKDTYSNYYGGGKELTNGASEFDKSGKANIEFSTQLADEFIQSQVALLEVTPTIGAIPSFGKIVKLIHRGEFALFFDEVEGNTTTGLSGFTEALDHKNPRRSVGNMKGKLTLTKKEYYASDGQVIEARDIELDGKGRAGFTFRNLKEGSYELKSEFVDPRGNKVTGIQMAYVGAPTQFNGTTYSMGVAFDKQKYKEGETARATVTSNFLMDDVYVVVADNKGGAATRIDSVERKKGEGRTRSFTISVPVKKDTGAVGVNVYAVTKGQMAVGQGTFTVDTKPPKLTTSIGFDKKKYNPGDQVKVKLTTKDENGKGVAADNSLSIIDAAILQLGKLKTGIVGSFTNVNTYVSISHYDSLTGIYADGPGGGGGCFLEGTQILMGDGTSKNIEDVRVGDTILTKKSDNDSEAVKNTVEKTFAHTVTEYLLINNRLKVTPIHRIYLNNKWGEASEAKLGDTLLDANGSAIKITSIMRMKGIFRVYNLTTTPSHTFFADGIYVHNEKGMDPRQNFVDTLYWNPHISTDRNGEATVSFKLADNVTTFTAQAFSNTKDSLFGEATESIVSYRDLTLVPSLSAFYYQNDKPVISVMVQNTTANDMDLTIHTGVKELSWENLQDVHVGKNDLTVISVPLELRDLKGTATFTVEAKDKGGRVVDSVILKKPILPQGNIMASWESFENSYDHTFSAEFPTLDINRMNVSIVPNAAAKLFRPYHYISQSLATSTGKQLYAYAYILARTRDGFIDPTAYSYATDRNSFRDAIEVLSENRSETVWQQPPYGYPGEDSFEASNLWMAKAFEQAAKYGMVDEITNAKEMATSTLGYFKSYNIDPNYGKNPFPQGWPPPPPPVQPTIVPVSVTPTMYPTPTQSLLTPTPSTTPSGIMEKPTLPPIYYPPIPPANYPRFYTNGEKLVRALVYGQQFTNDGSGFDISPEGLATQALAGGKTSLQKLIDNRVPSASDRYIWDGATSDSPSMPVVALVEKGSIEDAEKAIRGISFSQSEADPLELYAAFRYAERKNITVSKVKLKVTVNGEKQFEVPMKEDEPGSYPAFSHVYSTKNSKNGKVHLEFKSEGSLPVYGTVSEFAYTSSKSTMGKGNYRALDINLTRNYKDIETGQTVGNIDTGKAGVVVLSSETARIMKGSYTSNAYSFFAEDALSPNFLYLEQYDAYYNPQFQSVLKKLFPTEGNGFASYTLPESYTEQAIFFSGSGNINSRAGILPYVVYNASAGTYYRPKSSIVFPVLGIIATEK